ncbi:hypothetical protein E2562_009523 [Oryza meyeriana var. granulata]|uniref:Uncharacterized protein n=1 Tax=Oryza meyeriana var. granulata TaxID=110450 RepID=A0A6G1F5W2_9ORYZ|nr:hypothetical protein E2562_009523 [Oryza meyeriana var. granulata]
MATEERMLLLQRSGGLAAAAGGDRLDLAQSDEPVCAEFLALKRANLALLPSPEEEKGRVHGTLGSLFGQRGRRRLQASQGLNSETHIYFSYSQEVYDVPPLVFSCNPATTIQFNSMNRCNFPIQQEEAAFHFCSDEFTSAQFGVAELPEFI